MQGHLPWDFWRNYLIMRSICWKICYQWNSCLKLQLLKSDGICLKGWCAGNIDCNKASWVSKFKKINQLSYCVTFLYIPFTVLSLVRYLTMSRNFLVVLYKMHILFFMKVRIIFRAKNILILFRSVVPPWVSKEF